MIFQAFDNDLYLKLQAEEINRRIESFDNKLYLEVGGKIFDDLHASRVLPGFKPTSKIDLLSSFKDKAEVVLVVNCKDIASNKIRSDFGITYEDETLRMMDEFKEAGLKVNSIVLSFFEEGEKIKTFTKKLKNRSVKFYKHYQIAGYPQNISLVVSSEGLGKNEYIKTTQPLVMIVAPGPGSGKLATALSQLYHDNKNGIRAGYAKYETFPVWNLPLNHPVNVAYEAATADLNDINMIDPFHLEKYSKTSVNYNRDIESFPLLKAIFEKIYGESPYNSPTDMGVNMAGFAISNDEVAQKASCDEIIRRYYEMKKDVFLGKFDETSINKIDMLMHKLNISTEDRKCVDACHKKLEKTGQPSVAIELPDGQIITGKRSELLGASAAVLLNALKKLSGINDDLLLIQPNIFEPIKKIKTESLGNTSSRIRLEEILIALAIQANSNPLAELALKQLPKLRGSNAHSSNILSEADRNTFKNLGIHITEEPVAYSNHLFFK